MASQTSCSRASSSCVDLESNSCQEEMEENKGIAAATALYLLPGSKTLFSNYKGIE